MDDLIADIAVVFHWGPEHLFPMELEELIRWHKLAIERAPSAEGM